MGAVQVAVMVPDLFYTILRVGAVQVTGMVPVLMKWFCPWAQGWFQIFAYDSACGRGPGHRDGSRFFNTILPVGAAQVTGMVPDFFTRLCP